MQPLDFKQIAIWVGIWLFGYVLGLFEAWVKNKSKKEEKPEPEIIQAPPQLIEEDYALALFENENALTLKLDKAELTDIAAMEESQRQRLIALVVKLRPWLEGKKAPAAPPKPKPQVPRPAPAPAPAPRQADPQPAYMDFKSQPIQPISAAEELEYNKLSMVEQIDWLLQKKLENHPLKARRIRLQAALTGGVNFVIGEENFEFIDEIPYPEIRTIIQLAINEWEKKSTPGQ